MKRILASVLMIGVVAFVCSGCATPIPIGSLFTEVTLPVAATSNTGGSNLSRSDSQKP